MVMSVLLVVMVAVEFHPSCHRCTLVVSLMRMGRDISPPCGSPFLSRIGIAI